MSHSVGCRPRATPWSDAFGAAWKEGGPQQPWDTWMGLLHRFQQNVGSILGVNPLDVVPTNSVSEGLWRVLSALFTGPGVLDRKKIVFHQDDFPSLHYVIGFMQRFGAEPTMIPSEHDALNEDVWQRFVDKHTACCLITHAFSHTGKLQNLSTIVNVAHAAGAFAIVDCAQSFAAAPFDATVLNADVVVGSCVKWACGGPGAGFLFVRSDWHEKLQPIAGGWFAHAKPFAMRSDFEYAPGVQRFAGATPNPLAYAQALDGIAALEEVGLLAHRWQNIQNKVELLHVGFQDAGVKIVSPRSVATRSGTLVVDFPRTKDWPSILRSANVYVDQTPRGFWRVSPHVYTDKNDIDGLVKRMAA